MSPIKFPGYNRIFGKSQPGYLPLPAHINDQDPYGTVTSCWRLSWWERLRVLATGRIWWQQWTFREPLQPQRPDTIKPQLEP